MLDDEPNDISCIHLLLFLSLMLVGLIIYVGESH